MLYFLALLSNKFHRNEPWGSPGLSCLFASSFNHFYTSSGPLILKENLFGVLRVIGLLLYAIISAMDRQTKVCSFLFKSAVIHPDKRLCSLQKIIFFYASSGNKQWFIN